jgi:hypothetical protein
MMCKLDPYYLVNYNKICIIYFIGKQSDMLNDVDIFFLYFQTSSPVHGVTNKLAEKREDMYNAR